MRILDEAQVNFDLAAQSNNLVSTQPPVFWLRSSLFVRPWFVGIE
jgi:hypothetical protein